MSNNDETHDSYAVVSELTDDDDFLKVWEKEGNETFVELPKEDDGTILLATLQGQFPNAVGLKYLSSSGGWRGVRITDDALNPPHGGWGDANYYVTLQKADSAKAKPAAKESDLEEELLQDLFVLRLPKDITDEDLRDYFTDISNVTGIAVNTILKAKCQKYGLEFCSNDNMNLSHLNSSGLHLNDFGS